MSTLIANKTDLFVTGEIGYDFTAEAFIQALNYMPKDEEINVHIYSGGGSLFDALAVYDFVKLKGIKFNAYISGLAGSAATIIGAAAEKSYIGENSFYFVHRAFMPYGVESDEQQALLDSANERITSIYQNLTGLSKPNIKKLLDAGDKGAFLSGKEAVEYGFVSAIFKEQQLAASIEFYQNKVQMKEEQVEELKGSMITEVKNFVSELFAKKDKEVSEEALEKAVKESVSARIEAVKNEIEAEKVSLLAKIEELERENEALKVTPMSVENNVSDPDPSGEPKSLNISQQIMMQVFKS